MSSKRGQNGQNDKTYLKTKISLTRVSSSQKRSSASTSTASSSRPRTTSKNWTSIKACFTRQPPEFSLNETQAEDPRETRTNTTADGAVAAEGRRAFTTSSSSARLQWPRRRRLLSGENVLTRATAAARPRPARVPTNIRWLRRRRLCRRKGTLAPAGSAPSSTWTIASRKKSHLWLSTSGFGRYSLFLKIKMNL